MARRGGGPGKEFDDQWNESHRSAQKKKSEGRAPWADDKRLEGMYRSPSANKQESCGKAAVILLALLGGVGYAAAEAVRYIT